MQVLSDFDAPGRRAPKAVLAAAADDSSSYVARPGYGESEGLGNEIEHGTADLYDDELDDSLEAFGADGRVSGVALPEDLEEAAHTVCRPAPSSLPAPQPRVGGHNDWARAQPSSRAQARAFVLSPDASSLPL